MSRQELAGNNNQVPPGYKQTEVGVIPEDWEVTIIDEVTSEVGDGLHATPLYSDQGNYYFINGNNLVDSKIYVDTITQKCDQSEAKKYQQRLNQRTILLSINGTIGNLAFYQGEPVILGKSVAYLNPTKNISKNYLYYQLQTQTIKNFFRNGLTGTTIFNLGLGTIRKTPIAIPPLPEQKAIASVLSDVDELISSLDKLIAKKRHIKTATMQQLLTGKTRLPGFGEGKGYKKSAKGMGYKKSAKGMGYKKSAIGLIPEDWEVKIIDNIGDVKTGPFGSVLHESDYVKYGTPIITVEHLGDFGVEHINLPMVSDQDKKRLKSYILKMGDIVFSRVGSIDRNALITDSESGWLFSGRLLRIRIDNEKYYPQYFSYHFHSKPFKQRVVEVAVGQTMPSLNTQILRNIKIVIPPLPEQKAIASVLSDMDKEIAALEKRRAKTQGIKQGMMQELLTGRTRLINNYNGK